MSEKIQVAIIGDFNPDFTHHIATDESLKQAAALLSIQVDPRWVPTDSLDVDASKQLEAFDAIWCSSGSPYRSMEGALSAIRFARERNRPFFATWGGFQHTLVEYARNVLGISDAEHEETAPGADTPIISKLSCSLRGLTQELRIFPNTKASEAYRANSAMEQFLCNYGVNPEYQERIMAKPIIASGVGPDGEVRMIELPGHPFFLATLFVPQMTSTTETPHPLIVDFLRSTIR